MAGNSKHVNSGTFSRTHQPDSRRSAVTKRQHARAVAEETPLQSFPISGAELHTAWQALMLSVQWFDDETKKGNPPPPGVRNSYMRLANKLADLLTLSATPTGSIPHA